MEEKNPTPKKPEATNSTTNTSTQTNTSSPAPTGKMNGVAIAAIIFAILFPIVGLILGIVALSQIKKSHENGKGLAIASIIVSVAIMVLGLLIFFFAIFTVNSALKHSGVNVDGNGSVSVKNDEGESFSLGNTKLPEGFPSDVPVYKPSDVASSLKTKEGMNVTLITADSAQKVSDFYKTELKNNGWSSAETEFSSGSAFSTSTYTKGDQQLVLVITSDQNNNSDKKTGINLTIAAKKTN